MKSSRVEALSDGIIAIIITIMVLGFKVPQTAELEELKLMIVPFVGYVVSFLYVGIYWNNHHHLFQAVDTVDSKLLWANLNWLFWLSLLPVGTQWIGEHPNAPLPVVLYTIILLLLAIAYLILQKQIIRLSHLKLATIFNSDYKGKLSVLFYFVALIMAFLSPLVSEILLLIVAIIWIVPDKRIERAFSQ